MSAAKIALLIALLLVLWFLLAGGRNVTDAEELAITGHLNHNPLNVKPLPLPEKWQGQIGVDYRGLSQFDTLENGMRAGAINALAKFRRRSELNLVDFGQLWAPAGVEGNESGYGEKLAAQLLVVPTEPFGWTNRYRFTALLGAIAQNEQGDHWQTLLSGYYGPAAVTAFQHFGVAV